jgi:hypothetical protein
MKFIAFSDQHLESKLYNIPELEQDNRDLFKLAVATAIEYKVDYLVSVGDLFDHNKPSSDTISFVTEQINKLKKHSVTPVALAGDHSKPVNGATWETVCGFDSINSVPQFVGVDYSDNPADIVALVNHELNKRDTNSVHWIFMHQQIPELWPFCEDKKKISLKELEFGNQCRSLEGILLGDIHIRRTMQYYDINCQKELFVGYCGSLGVTAGNETKKDGLYYYDGAALTCIPYKLPREYVTVDVADEDLDKLTPELFKRYQGQGKRPVFLVKIYGDVQIGNKLNFLYELGFVKITKVKKDEEGREELINIRSELKTADRFGSVLRELTVGIPYEKLVYDTAYKLLTSHDPKAVLDEFKAAELV